jgi:hypothetical protein
VCAVVVVLVCRAALRRLSAQDAFAADERNRPHGEVESRVNDVAMQKN